jgi:hypothetical protein
MALFPPSIAPLSIKISTEQSLDNTKVQDYYCIIREKSCTGVTVGQPWSIHDRAKETGKTAEQLVRSTIAKHGGNVRRASIELDVSTEAIYRILRRRDELTISEAAVHIADKLDGRSKQ